MSSSRNTSQVSRSGKQKPSKAAKRGNDEKPLGKGGNRGHGKVTPEMLEAQKASQIIEGGRMAWLVFESRVSELADPRGSLVGIMILIAGEAESDLQDAANGGHMTAVRRSMIDEIMRMSTRTENQLAAHLCWIRSHVCNTAYTSRTHISE